MTATQREAIRLTRELLQQARGKGCNLSYERANAVAWAVATLRRNGILPLGGRPLRCLSPGQRDAVRTIAKVAIMVNSGERLTRWAEVLGALDRLDASEQQPNLRSMRSFRAWQKPKSRCVFTEADWRRISAKDQ